MRTAWDKCLRIQVTRSQWGTLVRQVTGWPQLPEDPQPWERDEQAKLDADLETRLSGYFQELGKNAYAAFYTMTDIASRPPQSPRFRRDRPNANWNVYWCGATID